MKNKQNFEIFRKYIEKSDFQVQTDTDRQLRPENLGSMKQPRKN